jgi:hypothetical protein
MLAEHIASPESLSDRMMPYRFLFCLCAILMLPFASFFLSARLRSRIGARWVVMSLITLLIIIPAGLAVVLPDFLESPYLRFMDEKPQYYEKIARACDLMLQQHPLGTNATVVSVLGSKSPLIYLRLPTEDPSIPKIIRDLGPSQIELRPKAVFVMVGIRDYSFSWALQDGRTNVWALTVGGDGPSGIVYAETNH